MKKILFYLFTLISLPQLIASTIDPDTKEKAQHYLKNQPVRFLENKGQMTDMANNPVPFVLFKSEAPGINMYITEKGITYVFIKAEEEKHEEKEKKGEHHEEKIEVEWNRVDMNLKGAIIKKENIIKEGQSTDFKQYFLGHCPNGITDVRSYEKITIKEIYPGIDWVLYNSNKKGFKYDFIVYPGANATDIAIVYNSQKPIKLNEQGELEIKTKLGNLTENKPYSYIQETNTEIKSAFKMSEKRIERNHYETAVSIELFNNENLRNQTIVIDPQLVWGTFYGDTSDDGPRAISTDKQGSVFIGGYTKSSNFPLQNTGSFFQGTNAGSEDSFILKFDLSGILIWSTYYGGSGSERVTYIDNDLIGNIFIVGYTYSSNFPTQSAGSFFQGTITGVFDNSYILKFDNLGNRIFATYFGDGNISAIATDVTGNFFITGRTSSISFPTQNIGSYFQSNLAGAVDAFISKFDNAGNLLWSTYYGGTGGESGQSVTVDLNGNVIISGYTSSSNFPIQNAGTFFQSNYVGLSDAFIVKFDNSGNRLWATYYGGSSADNCYRVTTDSKGNIVITGHTNSSNFPLQNNGTFFQGTIGGGLDAFIVKFDSMGNRLWATYYGGAGTEQQSEDRSIGFDSCDNLYVSFWTGSNNITTQASCDSNFLDNSLDGTYDQFITKFSGAGDLLWASYIGGDGLDQRTMIAIDENNNLFACSEVEFVINNLSQPLTNLGGSSYYDDTPNGKDLFITKFKKPSLTLTPTIIAAGCSCAGTASVTTTGGCVSAYKYKWYNSSATLIGTAQNLTNLCAGNYKVIVSDTINCSFDSLIVTIAGGGGSIPINSITATAANCNGAATGSASVTVTNASATYTYSWSNGTSGTSTATQFTATNLLAGIYTVTVSDGSCSNTSTVSITAPPSITPSNITPTSASCGQSNGSAITTTATGGTGTLTYSWSNGNSGQTATNLSAQTYTLTVSDANNCSTTTTVNIGNTGGASISTLTKTDALCNGGTGNATVNITGGASGNYTYSWSNGANTITSATSNQALLTSNTYTVTVIDGSCTVTSVVSITQPTPIVASAVQNTPASCGLNNGEAIASATGGNNSNYNYVWSNGATTSTATGLAAATYIITVSDANNCTQTTSVNISNSPAPTINSLTAVNPLCNGATGTASVTATGTGTLTYVWSNGNTTTTATNLTAGNYNITVTDGNGCKAIQSFSITEPSAITISNPVITNAYCNQSNGSISITTSGGIVPYTYNWSNGTSTITNSTTQQLNNLITNTYTVTVTDVNNCSQTTSITVGNSNGTTILAATATAPLCNGNTGSATVTITPSTPPYTYSWSNGASTITTATSNQEQLTSNAYTVTVTDANNCSTTTTVQINQPTVLSIATPITTDASCNQSNGSISITATGGTTPYTYNWSNGVSNTTTSATSQISNLISQIYTLTLTDNNNCSATTSTTIVNINSSVNAAVTTNISSNTINEGESIVLSAGGGTSYTWTPNNTLSCATCPVTIANPTATTTYTLIAKDNLGCTDTTDITINVKKPCTGEEDVFIANVFSPNNDGKNDVLQIQGNGLTNIYFAIYDRWGNLMFETRDQAQGWDGNVNGNTVNAGTYVYYLKATCKKTLQEIILKGNVSVVK